jgi:transcriptional regulator with XRE-family HTH domain
MLGTGERLQNIRRLQMWTQARLAQEAGVSPTTVSGIETGKIGRPHYGTLGKLARALRVTPEELLGSRAFRGGPTPLSMGWARDSGESEFERGLEGASLASLDSLSRELDAEQERLQRLYGEFPEASEQRLVHKAPDPRGGRTVGLGKDFGHGPPQPAQREACRRAR